MCAPSPPPTPDYTGSAIQQGQANVEAAKAQGKINNPNVVTPYGTQTVTYGGEINQPAWDAAQQTYQRQLAEWQAAGGVPRRQIGMSRNQPVYADTPKPTAPNRSDYMLGGDPDQATLTQTLSPEQQALYDQRVSTQQKLGVVAGQGADALSGVVGTAVDFSGAPQTSNYDDTRKTVIDAYMSRANEDYAKQSDQSNSNLVAAGIRPGTKAYADAQQMIERSRNDAYQNAEIQGGNAAAQAYGVDDSRRNQYIKEYLGQRQTPLNEITALLSGSQVSNPFTAPGYAQNAQVAPAPLFGATQAMSDYNTDLYNVDAAQAGNLQSGLFGLGGSALMGGGMAMRR